MTHTPHELSEAFPDQCETIRALKARDPHFARITDEYHTLNRAIHRAETDIEPISEFALEDLKKNRLRLLDEVAAALRDVASA